MVRTKIKITSAIIDDARQLANKGYTNIIIADSLGVGIGTCSKNMLLRQAIKEGRADARKEIVDVLMQRSLDDQSPTAAIFLAKQLKVYDEYYPTATPKTPQDALNKIASIFVSVSRNQLSGEKGTHLIGYLEKFIKAFEVSEIEKRLDAIEKTLDVR